MTDTWFLAVNILRSCEGSYIRFMSFVSARTNSSPHVFGAHRQQKGFELRSASEGAACQLGPGRCCAKQHPYRICILRTTTPGKTGLVLVIAWARTLRGLHAETCGRSAGIESFTALNMQGNSHSQGPSTCYMLDGTGLPTQIWNVTRRTAPLPKISPGYIRFRRAHSLEGCQ